MPAEIVDLHVESSEDVSSPDMAQQILDGLSKPFNQKRLPTMLLYNERGLRLYDDITTEAPEYYLFAAEEEILKNRADDIVSAMHGGAGPSPDEVIVELGAGALRKTSHILLGLSRLVREAECSSPICYYALDLEKRELQRVLDHIELSDVGRQMEGSVIAKGMWGTYDDGLKFIQSGGLPLARTFSAKVHESLEQLRSSPTDLSPIIEASESSEGESCSGGSNSSLPSTPDELHPPLHIMFLGSSLGNFSRNDATEFLRSLPLRPGSGDTLLLGLDHDNDKTLIEEAYNDPKGYTAKFIFNGLKVAGHTLGRHDLFDEDKWEYVNSYDVTERRHEAFFKSKCVHTIIDPVKEQPITFLEGEMVKIEESLKFSDNDAFAMFAGANLRPVQRWTDANQRYSLWLLERPPFVLPSLNPLPQSQLTSYGMPSRLEWNNIWKVWDFIWRTMISTSMLYQRPIDLRHICLFYLGHIPTFLDIQLSNLSKEPNSEPVEFKYIFERGIDPDVDDPEQCHPHSEVPVEDQDWPSAASILKFQRTVRERLMRVYDDIESGKIIRTRQIGRVLFMTLEHEAMHAETLLYMLLQRAGKGTLPPHGFMRPNWETLARQWAATPPPVSETVVLGPAVISLGHDDREDGDSELLTLESSHEFGWDNENPRKEVLVKQFRIEWRPVTNLEFFRFFIGEGKDKVEFPATWEMDGHDVLVKTMYGPVPMQIAKDWPVITSFNNLSTYASVKGGRLPTEPELRLFYDMFEAGYDGGSNVGFRNWHPVPATTGGKNNGGRGTNGGVWEWTSTVFDQTDDFVPSELYPGYSADFFDGKHNVVLGGSYATVPRISERRSFRNWYQRNYAYAWVGGRIAYDLPQ